MTNYKVSIGVPVYNAAKYIERCARSIFSQSYENLDIVFVDDCSPDDSSDIIRRVLSDYPHRQNQTRILRHDHNSGVSVARNTLLSHFQGEFFSFVDADDYLMPNAVALLVSKQKETNSDIVSGQIRMVFDDHEERIINPNFDSADDMLRQTINEKVNHNNIARIYRTSIVNEHNVDYPEGIHIGEDWQFFVHYLMYAHNVATAKDVIYVYDFTNQQSAMHSVNSDPGKFYLSDIVVLDRLKNIVSTKGRDYADAVEHTMALRIENGLLLAWKNNDRRLFNKLRSYIKHLNKTNIDPFYHYRRAAIGPLLYLESYTFYFWLRRMYIIIRVFLGLRSH